MKLFKMIKLIKSLEELSKKERKSIIKRMILEEILNSWQLPLYFICFIFYAFFIIIGVIFEKLAELFQGILATIFQELAKKIKQIKFIQLSTQEERKKLIRIIREHKKIK